VNRGAHHRRPVPLAVHLYRTVRVFAHVIEGLATAALVFPLVDLRRRHALIRGWSRRVLATLRIELRIHGLPAQGLPGNLLIVANHVSWLDIVVLNALQPSRFIAKAEMRAWPLVGRLSTACGTLYVDRERRHATHAVNRSAAAALARGDVITVFPEGTTTDGSDVLPFHGSLLQPVVDASGHVQPIAIRYCTPLGERTDATAYVGETSLMESFWRVTGERALQVELQIAPPLAAQGRHRRELARDAESAIRTALASPAAGSAPDRPGDPRA